MTIDTAIKSSSRLWQIVQVFAAVATFLGLVATFYFSFTANKSKSIEVAYLAKLSLVNPTASSKEQIKVSFSGRDVNDLVQMSVRLLNSGTLPIEKRDIEQPITFRFTTGTILAAAIVRRFPENLQASLATSAGSLIVNHGLLNPGDYVDFEVISDGDPGWLTPIFRITGVSAAHVSSPRDRQQVARPAYFNFSRSVELSIMAVATCIPILLVIVLPLIISIGCRGLWSASRVRKAFRSISPTEENMKRAIDLAMIGVLPIGMYKVDHAIDAVKYDQSDPKSYLSRAEEAVLEAISKYPFWQRIEWALLIPAIVALLLCLALSLVLAGSWSSVLQG